VSPRPAHGRRSWQAMHERGAGSILVLCGVMIVLVALLTATALGGGILARHRAAAAADLAALAAAEELRLGTGSECAEARAVAETNGGVLQSCQVEGSLVEVAVTAPVVGPSAWLADPVRRARAGPDPNTFGGRRTVPGGATGMAQDVIVSGWAVPLAGDYRITAGFGESGPAWSSGRHTGLDFAAPAGTPVRSAADGRVREAGTDGRYGNLVKVDHGGVVTYYAHLSRIAVRAGDVVRQGQQLGTVGSTGNATGPHLHFEVRIGGVARDPAALLGLSVPGS
jgi:secretion/DNA translocation related TadE-like protein